MWPWQWFARWRARWHRIQRDIDRDVLWRACKEQAHDLDHARAAFAVHAFHDPAWLALGEDELINQIEALK